MSFENACAMGDLFNLVLPEFPELRFQLVYFGGRCALRYGIFTKGRYRGYSRRYRKRFDCVVRGFFILMVFGLGEIYSERELDRLFGDDDV